MLILILVCILTIFRVISNILVVIQDDDINLILQANK